MSVLVADRQAAGGAAHIGHPEAAGEGAAEMLRLTSDQMGMGLV